MNISLEFPWPLNTSGSLDLMRNQIISIPDIQDFVLKCMHLVGINGTFPSLNLVGLGNFGFSIEKFVISLDKGNLSRIQMTCNVPGWDALNKFKIKLVEPKLHIQLDFQSESFSASARGFITKGKDVGSGPYLPGLPVELTLPQNVTEFLEIRCVDERATVHFTQLLSLLSIHIERETLKAISELCNMVEVPMLLLRVPPGLPTLSLERITVTSTERFTVLGNVTISNATLDITEGRMSFSASIDICGQYLTVAMTETKSGQHMTFETLKNGNYINVSMLLGAFISCVEKRKERQPDISFGHMKSSLADIQLPKLKINYTLNPKVEATSITIVLEFLAQWNAFSRASLSTKLLNSTIRIDATRTEGSFPVEVKAAVFGTIVIGTPVLVEFPFVLSIPTSFKAVKLSLQDGKRFRTDFGKVLQLERLSGVFPQFLSSILTDVLITKLVLKFPTSLNGSFEISNIQLHTLSNAALNFGFFYFEDLRVNYSYKETQIRGQIVFGNFSLACQMDWTPINKIQAIWLSSPVEMTDLRFFTEQIHKVFFGGKMLPLDFNRVGLSSIPNFSLAGMVLTLSNNLTVSNVLCKVYLPKFSWDLFGDFFSVDQVSLTIDVDIGSPFAMYVNGIVDLVDGKVKLPFEMKIPSLPNETVGITLPKYKTVRVSFSQLTGILNTATSIQFPGIVESFLPEVLLEKLAFSFDHSLTSFTITEFEALSVQPWDLGGIGVLELNNVTVRMDENAFEIKGLLLLGNTYLELELANMTLSPIIRLAKPKHVFNLRRLIQDGLRKMIPSLTSVPDPDLLSLDVDNGSLIQFAQVRFSNNLDSLIAFSLQVQLSTTWTFFKSCCTLISPTMNLRVTDLNDVPTYYLTVTSSVELQGDSDSLVLPLECNIPASLLSTITLRLTEPVVFNLSKITVLPLVGKLIPPGLLSPISSVIGNVRLWPLVAHFQPQTAEMSALNVVVTALKDWTFNGFPLTLRNIVMELGFETSKALEFHAALFGTFFFQRHHVSFQMPFPATIPDLAEMNMDFGGLPDIDMSKIGQLLIGGFNLENLFPSVIANLKISLKHLQLHLLTPLQNFKLHGFRLRFSLNESITLLDNWLTIEDIAADLNVTTTVQVRVSGTLSCFVILGTGSNVIQTRGVVSMPSVSSQAWKLKLILDRTKVLSLVSIVGLIGGGFDLRSVLPDNVVAIADKIVMRRLEASLAPKPGFEVFNITCTLEANSTDLLLPLRIKIQDILIKLSINNPFDAAKRAVTATIYVSVKLGEIVVPTALSVENDFVRLEINDLKQRLSMKDLASLIGGDILLNAVPVPLKILNQVTLQRVNITFERPQLKVLAASLHCELKGFDVGFSFPLPLVGPDNVFGARLELQRFTLTLNQNKEWKLIGAIQASFTGIPQILEQHFNAIQGFLTVSSRLVEFKIARNLQDVSVSMNLAGINCNLNVKFYDPKVTFRTPSVPEVGLTLAVTGFDALNTFLPFKVFEDKLEMVVSITEKKGLSIRLVTFPILKKIIPCQKRVEEYTCDFTWLCQSDSYLTFRLPSLGYTKDGFTAAIDVQGLDKLCLPLALPFITDFFKNIPFLSNLFKLNIPLWPPPDIIGVLQNMGVNIENLPGGMARFRSPAFPREISVLLSVAGNGPLALSIEVQNNESLDIMLPAAFTSLAGVSLRRLSIGTTFGVPFIDIDVDVYLWQLHYLLLLSNLPKDNPMLINAEDMETRIMCKDCFIVILGSIPVPVFAAPFYMEYATLVDARAHVTIYHRRPEFKDFGVLASFVGGLFKFFTDRNYLLSMTDFASVNSSLLVVKFSQGNKATMVQLPKFTGGTQLRLDIPPFDGRAFLIGWMNFFKTLEPGWLLKIIPLQYRLFDVAFTIGPFRWSLIRFAASSANELKQNKQMWPYAVKSNGDDALIIASANLPLLSTNVELRVKNFGNAGLAFGLDCGITQVVKISFNAQASIDLEDSRNPLTISSDAKLMLFDSLLLEGKVVVTKDKISIYGLLRFSFLDILQFSGEAQAVFGPGLSFILDTGIDLRFIGVTLANGHLHISDSPSKTFVRARALFMGSELNIELVRHGVAISLQAQVKIGIHLRVDLGRASVFGKDIGRIVLDTGFDCSLNIAFPGKSSLQASFHFMGNYITLPSLSFDTRDARPERIPGLLVEFVKKKALSLIKDIFLNGPEILIRALIEGILDFAGDLGGLVKDFLETGFKLGADLVKKVGEFLDKLADAGEALTERAQQVAKKIAEAAEKAKDFAVKVAEEAKETTKKVFKEAEQSAKKVAVAGERLVHAAAKVIRYESVVKEGKKVLDNISTSLSATVNRIIDIGKKIADDIARGLRNLAGKVVQVISGWFGKRSIHRRDALLIEKELRTKEKARLQKEQSNQRSQVRSKERQLKKAMEEEQVARMAHDAALNEAQRSAEKLKKAQQYEAEKLSLVEDIRIKGKCVTGENNCHPNATCLRTGVDGQSFKCICRRGWIGDGIMCEKPIKSVVVMSDSPKAVGDVVSFASFSVSGTGVRFKYSFQENYSKYGFSSYTFNSPGIYHIQVLVGNKVSNSTVSDIVIIQTPVSNVTLATSGERRACRAVELFPSANGTNVSFNIDFGDNTSSHNTISPLKHYFPYPGRFVINVNASNLVSFMNKTFVLEILPSACDSVYCDLRALELSFPAKSLFEMASLSWHISQSVRTEMYHNRIWKFLAALLPLSRELEHSEIGNQQWRVKREYIIDSQRVDIGFVLAGILSSRIQDVYSLNPSLNQVPFIKEPLHTFTWLTAVLLSTEEFISTWSIANTSRELCQKRLSPSIINGALDGFILGKRCANTSQSKKLSDLIHDYYCPSKERSLYSWQSRYTAFYNLSHILVNSGYFDSAVLNLTLLNLLSNLDGFSSPTDYFCLDYWLESLMLELNKTGRFPQSRVNSTVCSVYSKCSQCLSSGSKDGCFWCETSKKCLPNCLGATCNQSKAFYTSPCPENCNLNQGCTECVGDRNCGWCGSPFGDGSSFCAVGSPEGPRSTGTCDRLEWHYDACTKRCPLDSGQLCSGNGLCDSGRCNCFPGFYGSNCSNVGCVYSVKQNESIVDISKWSKITVASIKTENRIEIGTLWLAANTLLTLPTANDKPYCLNGAGLPKFDPLFPKDLRIANNKANLKSFCGLFGSLASEPGEGHSCNDIKGRNDCLRSDGCAWNVKDPCTGKVLEGCFKLTKWLDLIVYEGQPIFSPISGNIEKENNLIAITGWPRSEWDGYVVTVAHISPYNRTSVQNGQVIGTALQNKNLFLPVIIKVSVTLSGVYKNPFVHFLPCSPGCSQVLHRNNGICDRACNTKECNYDYGECTSLYSTNPTFSLAPRSIHDYFSVTILNVLHNLQRFTGERNLVALLEPISLYSLAKLIVRDVLDDSRLSSTFVYNIYKERIVKFIALMKSQNASMGRLTVSTVEKLIDVGLRKVSPYGRDGVDYDIVVIDASSVQNSTQFMIALDMFMESRLLKYAFVENDTLFGISHYSLLITKTKTGNGLLNHYDPTVEIESECDPLRTCSGHGVCLANGTCKCDSFYIGSNCQGNRCPNHCSDHGTCIDGLCVCNTGWDGYDCSKVKLCSALCPESWIGDGICDPDCNIPKCLNDNGDCDHICRCPDEWLSDGSCDQICNTTDCDHDGGDCMEDQCSPGCKSEMLADGICDHVCNTEQCDQDKGDCSILSRCSCDRNIQGNGVCDDECNNPDCLYDYGDCAIQVTGTECPVTCSPPMIGNGFCDLSCNISACKLDGGDCKSLVSESKINVCFDGCLHRFRGDGVCDSVCNVLACDFDDGDCPKPIIQECFPDCRLDMVGDGVCQSKCQVEECSFDAEDCQCALGCTNSSIGDGICNTECFVESCGYDKVDCLCSSKICPESFISNGHCDLECNSRICNFDGGDCTCAPGCSVTSISDGSCDPLCDTKQCDFDGLDCGGCDSELHSMMCDVNADCVVSNGLSPTISCQCKPGYYGDGFSCSKRGNCFNSSDACSINGICRDLNGTFECYCNPGWVGNGIFCENVNECGDLRDNCSLHADCVDLPGSYKCVCKPGWTGDGYNCTDVNECVVNQYSCCGNEECLNTEGNFTCVCKPGWRSQNSSSLNNISWERCDIPGSNFPYFSSLCVDVDECTEELHNCSKYENLPNSICTNTVGGFQCSCLDGWQGDGYYCSDLNECLNSSVCGANQICRNMAGNFTCLCDTGWTPSTLGDNQCEDLDECALGLNDCDTFATCINTNGSFSCECNQGFQDKKRFCTRYQCSNQTFLNESSSHQQNATFSGRRQEACSCIGEFSNSGRVCEDIDECQRNIFDCPPSAPVCQNILGGYECKCSVDDNSTCDPVNPCDSFNNTCHQNMSCIAVGVEHYCVCPEGYSEDDNGTGCVDIDECMNMELYGACDVHSDCVNRDGSFECRCRQGFFQSGDSCFEIDECKGTVTQTVEGRIEECQAGICISTQICVFRNSSNDPGAAGHSTLLCACDDNSNRDLDCVSATINVFETEGNVTTLVSIPWYLTENTTSNFTSINKTRFQHNCSERAVCKNTPGSYECICQEGFESNDGGKYCLDANECLFNNSCHANASCYNTFGSYTCRCKTGFTGNGLDNCIDEDECSFGIANCTHNSMCVNTAGGFFCRCINGFHRNEMLLCEDMDECSRSDLNECHARASCDNYVGAYNCSCKQGYIGNGFKCSDADECRDDLISCGDHATCYNTPGSYICQCNPGWSGDGTNCSNIDECALGLHSCIEHSYCTDNEGSYTCSCYPGWKRQWFEPYGRCSKCDSGRLCSGHGQCLRNGTCNCLSYYAGPNCSVCRPDIRCSGHGTCDFNGTCYCDHGWTRQILDCSICVPERLCSGHGLCNYDLQTYSNQSCFCDETYFGTNCSNGK